MSGLVVDTSVWIDFFAGRNLPELELALREGRVILPPVVFSELLSGKTLGPRSEQLVDFLEELDLHPTPRSHWQAVGKLRNLCRSRGFRISIPDAHVAQCALDAGGLLYSFDRIFAKIAKQAPLKLLQ